MSDAEASPLTPRRESDRSEIETAAVDRFLAEAFDEDFEPDAIGAEESAVVERVVRYVELRFNGLGYVLNLALDFAMVAQELSKVDPEGLTYRPELDEAALFARYPRQAGKVPKEPNKATRAVNTLTLTFKAGDKTHRAGIRYYEERVGDMFLAADRTGYTGAYIYNTGMWPDHTALLVDCFRLSESGRYLACQRLIGFAFVKLAKNTFFGRETSRVRLFEVIIRGYDRAAADGENAGMVMQGIAYGYFKADRPHLSLIVDKTRTGSAKQRRFGDIDCYYGLDLELSVEVKDEPILAANVETEVGHFAQDVYRHRVQGIAFVASKDGEAETWLLRKGVLTQDMQATLERAAAWDWRKQDAAVHGLLHFLAHVEHKPEAVVRLLKFIKSHDPAHDSLAYLKPDAEFQDASAAQSPSTSSKSVT